MTNETQIDWGKEYDGGKPTTQKFPPAGDYMLQVPLLGDDIFKTGNDGQLIALIDPMVILGGEHAGATVRFTRVSNKRYPSKNASSMADFILGCGSPMRPTTEAEWKAAVKGCSSLVVNAFCDWKGYDKVTKQSLAKRMTDFPLLADGSHQSFLEVPDVSAPGGKRRVWANLTIRFFRLPEL